jgi:hypothetical protein
MRRKDAATDLGIKEKGRETPDARLRGPGNYQVQYSPPLFFSSSRLERREISTIALAPSSRSPVKAESASGQGFDRPLGAWHRTGRRPGGCQIE